MTSSAPQTINTKPSLVFPTTAMLETKSPEVSKPSANPDILSSQESKMSPARPDILSSQEPKMSPASSIVRPRQTINSFLALTKAKVPEIRNS